MANTSPVTTIVKEGEKAASKAGKCAELAAELPVHAETLKQLQDYKKNTLDVIPTSDLTPKDIKELATVNNNINKLEKTVLHGTNESNKIGCPTLPPAPATKP